MMSITIKRFYILFLLMLGLILPAFSLQISKTQKPAKPNIIFILSDDHSAPYLSSYGHLDVKTPNIDRLAQEGIRFNRAYTTAPQCVPSRASLMTGRSVVDVRMTRFSAPLPVDIVTYPELLRKADYFTGICGRNFHLDGSKTPPETEQVFNQYQLRTFNKRVDYLNPGSNDEVLGQFQEFLSRVPIGKPFFIQVGYNDPHRPFNAKKYEPDPSKIHIPDGMPDTKELRKDLAGHYGEIQRLDHYVGLLLDELDKKGLSENTLIVFMGDNGAALLRGKGTLYDMGIHVPLLARLPGVIKKGSVSDALISGEDIAPTFLEIAGADIPESITGKSFLPVLLNPSAEIRALVFAERGAHGSGLPTNTANFDLGRTVVSKKYKLIYTALWQLPYHPVDFAGQPIWKELQKLNANGSLDTRFSKLFFSKERPMFELFDLHEDPNEYNNLAGRPEVAEIEKNLKAKLQEWMILNQDFLPLPVPPPNK